MSEIDRGNTTMTDEQYESLYESVSEDNPDWTDAQVDAYIWELYNESQLTKQMEKYERTHGAW